MCGFRTTFLTGRSQQLRGPGAFLGLTWGRIELLVYQRELNVATTGGFAAGAGMPLAKSIRCRCLPEAASTLVKSVGTGLEFMRDMPVFHRSALTSMELPDGRALRSYDTQTR